MIIYNKKTLVSGWKDGWKEGWKEGKAGLRIAYSNQKIAKPLPQLILFINPSHSQLSALLINNNQINFNSKLLLITIAAFLSISLSFSLINMNYLHAEKGTC